MLENFKYIKNISDGVGTMLLYSQIGDSVDENGNLVWGIKRSGTKTDTSYTIIPLAKDEVEFDTSKLEIFELEKTAVRDLPYADQDSFYLFGDNDKSEGSESTGSNLEW